MALAYRMEPLSLLLVPPQFPVPPARDHVAMLERVKESSYATPPALSPALSRLLAEVTPTLGLSVPSAVPLIAHRPPSVASCCATTPFAACVTSTTSRATLFSGGCLSTPSFYKRTRWPWLWLHAPASSLCPILTPLTTSTATSPPPPRTGRGLVEPPLEGPRNHGGTPAPLRDTPLPSVPLPTGAINPDPTVMLWVSPAGLRTEGRGWGQRTKLSPPHPAQAFQLRAAQHARNSRVGWAWSLRNHAHVARNHAHKGRSPAPIAGPIRAARCFQMGGGERRGGCAAMRGARVKSVSAGNGGGGSVGGPGPGIAASFYPTECLV